MNKLLTGCVWLGVCLSIAMAPLWAESGLRGLLVYERAAWKVAAGEFADFMTSLERQIMKGR